MKASVLALTISLCVGKPSKYTSESDDVRRMMEGVRMQTEGGGMTEAAKKSKSVLTSQDTQVAAGEFFPHEHDLDAMLMKKADEVQADMRVEAAAPDPTKPKASLGQSRVTVKESQSARAARFFATHGMGKVAHLLGDELSAKAAATAKQEQEAAEKIVNAKVVSSTSNSESLDVPDGDDVDDD